MRASHRALAIAGALVSLAGCSDSVPFRAADEKPADADHTGRDAGGGNDGGASTSLDREWLIAHALGGIRDETLGALRYTNTLEALEVNHDLGLRLFEVDLSFTSDGHLVGYHDANGNPASIGGAPPGELTLDEFLGLDYLDTYTPVSLEMLLELMATEHTDIALVCDFKAVDRFEGSVRYLVDLPISRESDVLERVIPEIYHQDEYELAMAIYPFRQVMYTLYREPEDIDHGSIVEFARETPIAAVIVTRHWLDAGIVPVSLFTDLAGLDVPTFIATIGEERDAEAEAAVESYQALGFHGFFTDFYVAE